MKRSGCSLGGKYVLDSFALLAFLQGEAGAPQVRDVLEYGRANTGMLFLSVVNLSECLYIVERNRGRETARHVLEVIQECPLCIVPASERHALVAARIKASYRVSLADAYAVALTLEQAATVVTGDPEFKDMEGIIPVLWLPRSDT